MCGPAGRRRTLIGADDILIVAAPDLANLRNAKNLVDLLRAARPNDNRPQYCLNQVGVPKRPEIKPADFAKALEFEPIAIDPVRAAAVRHGRQQRPDDRRGLGRASRGGNVPLARAGADRPRRGEAVAREPARPAASKSSGASRRKRAENSVFGKRSTSGPDPRSAAPPPRRRRRRRSRRARRAVRRERRRRPRADAVRRARRADHLAAARPGQRAEAARPDRTRHAPLGELLRGQGRDLLGADRGDRPVAARAARRRIGARGNPRHRQRDHRDQEHRDVDRRAGGTARRHLQRRSRLRAARAAARARRHRRHHGERRQHGLHRSRRQDPADQHPLPRQSAAAQHLPAHRQPDRPPRRRSLADLRRAPARRLARQRHRAAARDRRPGAHHPQVQEGQADARPARQVRLDLAGGRRDPARSSAAAAATC